MMQNLIAMQTFPLTEMTVLSLEKAPGVDGLSLEFLVNDYSNFLFLLVEIFQLKTYQ